MSKHRYPSSMRYVRTRRALKEIGFWALVAFSIFFMYVFFFWERAW